MKNRKRYECIKAIAKELRNTFSGMQANSYGFCCRSDYDAYHDYINRKDYVCPKLFKGGLNNNYHNGEFEVADSVWYMWALNEFKLNDVINAMNKVAVKYGAVVMIPEDELECIELVFN